MKNSTETDLKIREARKKQNISDLIKYSISLQSVLRDNGKIKKITITQDDIKVSSDDASAINEIKQHPLFPLYGSTSKRL